jgi:putative methyltransferase (TIGR04325 family)
MKFFRDFLGRLLNNEFLNRISTPDSIENAYENLNFQKFVAEKTKIFLSSPTSNFASNVDAAKLGVLGFLNTEGIEEIIEIGGGAGIDFFTASHFVDCQKAWTIYETSEMCEAVRSYGISHPRLKFRSDISVLSSEVGFYRKGVYLNSSIQYLSDPVGQLKFLLELGPRKIGILRTPLCQVNQEFEYLQESRLVDNGPQVTLRPQVDAVVRVKVRIIPAFAIRELFREYGYRIVLEESVASNFGISSIWNRSEVKNYLFLAQK